MCTYISAYIRQKCRRGKNRRRSGLGQKKGAEKGEKAPDYTKKKSYFSIREKADLACKPLNSSFKYTCVYLTRYSLGIPRGLNTNSSIFIQFSPSNRVFVRWATIVLMSGSPMNHESNTYFSSTPHYYYVHFAHAFKDM